MPNHVHFIVMPTTDSAISLWAHRLFATYSRRHHRKHGTTGRVWENRFKAFAIQGDTHLLIALRYVERNALRAKLADRAEEWPWSSVNWRTRPESPIALAPSPVVLPPDWVDVVNTPTRTRNWQRCVNA
jgi:putative transposase